MTQTAQPSEQVACAVCGTSRLASESWTELCPTCNAWQRAYEAHRAEHAALRETAP